MGSCKQTAAMAEENKKRAFLNQAPLSTNCGSPDADASDDETPQRRVSVKAFQLGKTEVTLGQFKKFIAEAGRSDLITDDFMKYNAYGDSAPVVMVSWHDAQAFIDWLNRSDGGGWRLPSEAEWEYACRAGGNQKYCGSNSVGEVAWHYDNSGQRPRAVGGKKANAFGLHDMSGNVSEWVQDCSHDNYSGAPIDGSAWTAGCSQNWRMQRGGSWVFSAGGARAAERIPYEPGYRGRGAGFRLARTR
jgi:formylglycine-generating enzyme required for sulfatase activity